MPGAYRQRHSVIDIGDETNGCARSVHMENWYCRDGIDRTLRYALQISQRCMTQCYFKTLKRCFRSSTVRCRSRQAIRARCVKSPLTKSFSTSSAVLLMTNTWVEIVRKSCHCLETFIGKSPQSDGLLNSTAEIYLTVDFNI